MQPSLMSRIACGILSVFIGHMSASAIAANQLPVPCSAGACGTGANSFVSTGAATAVQAGKNLTVQQTSSNATLNWASFNIGAGDKVVYKQPSSSAIALNRIYDANPSSIFGSLNANGQIYLINANGFLFSPTATVNVAGMIASSLNITDKTFASGILAPVQSNAAALEPFTDGSGNAIANTGVITVQQGAQLTAADGGRLLLAAPTVKNAGTLTAPDGQIVLAAGQSVYLQASDQPDLRGLIVQVDGSGTAANQLTGQLSTPRGNVTLTGLMVNQDGRISATTTVSANGSVRLEAANGVVFHGNDPITAQQGGQVELGPKSSIDVMPEYGSTATAVDAQAQLQSAISIDGQQVLMHGASITAPGGLLTVTAEADPDQGVLSGGNSQARIRIDAGTTIDLSGSDAELPMSANLVTVQLRSNELKDDPTQRNGALRGQTVTVDARADGGAGTPIADVSSAIAAVGKNIAQRTETGGTAVFKSEGDVVFNPGASLNVSGGSTTYLGGSIQTTALMGANGQLYDIGSANPLQTYTGVVNPSFTQAYDKWGVKEVVATPGLSHYEATYQQGAAAGSVQFAAPSLVLAGSFAASAVNGPHQRGPVGSAVGDAVQGGTLTIGLPKGAAGTTGVLTDYLAPSIVVVNHAVPIVVGDDAGLPPQTLQLPESLLTSDGFTSTRIYSNTTFSLPAGLPLQLPAGASLLVAASRIDIDSNITDHGGSVAFESLLSVADQDPNAPTLGAGAPRPGIAVGDGVVLDVSGLWTNDGVLAGGVKSGQTLQNAGSIALQLSMPASELVLGNDVSLKADGGAWLQSDGTLAYGTGGAITLDASPAQSAIQFGRSASIEAFGAGSAEGGSFALTAPRIDISQGNGNAWSAAQRIDDLNAPGGVLQLYAPLFSNDGFSSISLTATGAVESQLTDDVLSVLPGTSIVAQSRSLQLNPGYQTASSGGTLASLAHAVLLPDYLRQATNVSFNVLREADDSLLGATGYGAIDIQKGASIAADPGASISLAGEGSISIAGTLRAAGGDVSVQLLSPGLYDAATADVFDPGYSPNLGITLLPTSVIDVSGGAAVFTPNNQGLLLGTIRSGGSVSINAQRGTLVVDGGSLIDIAGSSATLDMANSTRTGGYTRETIATSGGSLTLASVESISLLGSIDGKAGVGGSGAAAAGSLTIDLSRSEIILGQPDLGGAPMEIDLVSSTAGAVASPRVDFAQIGVAQLESSGIDSLTLVAGGATAGTISIQTGQTLSFARDIVFNTRSLSVADGVAAKVIAPYVEIANPQTLPGASAAAAPTSGTGSLTVKAQQMTLEGNVGLQNVGSTVLTVMGDVQLQGTASQSGQETGSLLTAGNLAINASRIYPDSFTSFAIESQAAGDAAGGTVSIGQTAASPGKPLSAGGTLSISARNIAIGGTLLAPFGQIDLTAADSLSLSNGSLISVSGAGLDVPYGQTQDGGREWIYQTPGGVSTISGVPQKQVSLTAPNISVQPKATVDLQGGGDLYAYEWVPGTGGSSDALASSGSGQVSGLYAIVPSMRGQAGPFDPQNSGTTGAQQTVYLSGGAGVPAGYYALLPARYALEPGALLIQVEPKYVSASGGQIGSLADGTPIVAGFLSSGTTGLHSGLTEYEGFAVYSGSYAQQLAAYTISNASSFFGAVAAAAGTGQAALPADAGSLTFDVVKSLDNSFSLQGSVLTAAAKGGAGALVNISAPELEITSGTGPASSGSIAVSGSVLQSWNSSQLILGGSAANGGSDVTVSASGVTIDGGVQLSADQILIVAQQSIDLKSGASVSSTSGKAGTVLASLPALEQLTLTDSGGNALPQAGLLGVSDLELPVVARSGSVAGASITLEAGSHLNSGGALALDAPGTIAIAAGTVGGKGASWSLSSDSVSFLGSSASNDSLNVNSGVLAELQQAGAARISSQGAIDIFAPVTLGAAAAGSAPTLNALTLLGTAINNQSGGNTVLGASTLTLGGIDAGAAALPVEGSGGLTLVADTLNIGPNTLALNGFAHTVAQVAGAVESTGSGGLQVGGDLTINAVELAPGAGSQTQIAASGALAIGAPTKLRSGTELPGSVGGGLALSGTRIADAGVIAAPSGVVSLTATSGDLQMQSTASIDVGGTLLQVMDQNAAAPGGAVALRAAGDVVLAAGSRVNLAGSRSAPAGSLDITGGGQVELAGGLNGAAGAPGGTGASFSLDAGQLAGGLSPLASVLMSSGFNDSVAVRVRSGDLDLLSAGAIAANSIALTADTGAVNIAGVLTAASGAQRGHIDLSGGTGVTLQAGGQLHADGAGAAGLGGEIEINSTCSACTITLRPGSVISAAGAAQMGQLILRAPALASTNDIAVNVGSQGIGADVSRAGQVIVEPVMVFATSNASVDSDLITDVGIASSYLSSASPIIAARLTSPSATPFAIEAGVELQDPNAADALTIHSFDLSGYSSPAAYGGSQAPQVINLAVRAAGSVSIQGAISDGYVPDYNTGLIALGYTQTGPTTYGPAPSASLSLVAGADLRSANPLSVLKGSTADLTLLTSGAVADGTTDGVGPSVVRTGTGDINLAAAHDVVFQQGTSAYTGGEAPADVITPVGFRGGAGEVLQNFGENGGNVRVAAGNDVIGSAVGSIANSDNGNYSVTGWQLRQGNAQTAAQYGINFAAFDWNIGALEGGDVSVTAGRDVTNISAATADSLVSGSDTYDGRTVAYGAGGGLLIRAGGDIGSAQVFVADGVGTLIAGGGLTAVRTGSSNPLPVGTSIALGDSQVSVWARDSVQIDAIYNPTFVSQSQGPSPSLAGQYFTYGTDSAVSLSSTAGDVTLELNNINGTMATLVGAQTVADNSSAFMILPANLSAQAPQGNLNINNSGSAFLFPAANGQLSLLAGKDIEAAGGFTLSDNPAASFPTAADPGIALSVAPETLGGLSQFDGVVHVGDANPATITAGGDISGLYLSIPKAAQVVAGRDIVNLLYAGQNVSAQDTTLISAGRDFVNLSGTGDTSGVQLGGPGSLDVLVGRNADLGFSNGIVTVGNLANANLPGSQGADLNVMVGYGSQGADLSGFLTQIVAKSPLYQAQLTSYVDALTLSSGLSFSQAESEFKGFSPTRQSAFIDDVFFNELLLSGRAANSGSGAGFAQGYAAIDALYPGSRSTASGASPYAGDLTLTSSQIYTLSGGNISLLVPSGKIDVGLANPPTTVLPKPASQLGIVAQGTGNVSIYAQGDVNVNQSRIFTLGGGNILIWSDEGSIDAGNGSKSSLSVPPPVVLISANGTISLDFSGSLASGSGIRTIQTNSAVPPGNVDLDAPVGTVDAGDAGIGASGNINIAAAHVIGIDNINFGGTAAGVPSDISNLSASLSGVSAVASSSTSSAESSVASQAGAKETAPLAQTALSWLDVFVTGLGEDNCKPSDIECLKRQKTASP